MYVLPGLVDAHCHLRDPGYEYKEDISTGSRSAAKGGFTSIACMPNTDPVADNPAVVTYIIEKAKKEALVNVYPIGAITKGQKGEELAEMGSMKEAGIVAVSDDGRPVMKSSVMKKALIYAGQFNLPVISHCEDLDLAEEGSMNEGFMSTKLGLRGHTCGSRKRNGGKGCAAFRIHRDTGTHCPCFNKIISGDNQECQEEWSKGNMRNMPSLFHPY